MEIRETALHDGRDRPACAWAVINWRHSVILEDGSVHMLWVS